MSSELWFQSTHPRRVRPLRVNLPSATARFNPRTHVGCDLLNVIYKLFQRSFNPRTHVGCDLTVTIIKIYLKCFNPRTHVGCDEHEEAHLKNNQEFQSTHPRRVRQRIAQHIRILSSFNPRTHVGCDSVRSRLFRLVSKFQSTHPRRVRLNSNHNKNIFKMFQSTHPRRVRRARGSTPKK